MALNESKAVIRGYLCGVGEHVKVPGSSCSGMLLCVGD